MCFEYVEPLTSAENPCHSGKSRSQAEKPAAIAQFVAGPQQYNNAAKC
jgi:hypothetical protein